ncbi:MAG: hypothetical protein HY925_04585 [Elusimicrobia bacterium]|nr:hypothetical protein [Elusimicrobiota bacterium]
MKKASNFVLDLFAEDDPKEPGYDPVHLGATVVITLAALGCVYWLLWTLLVFEGGIFLKARALLKLAGGASLKDLGWEGSYAQGELEGWFGNVAALAFSVVIAGSLRRLYLHAKSRHRSAK